MWPLLTWVRAWASLVRPLPLAALLNLPVGLGRQVGALRALQGGHSHGCGPLERVERGQVTPASISPDLGSCRWSPR